MATIDFHTHDFEGSWEPGTDKNYWIGPLDILRYKAISVSAQPYTPAEELIITIKEVKIKKDDTGNISINVNMHNSGTNTIESGAIMLGIIGI